MPLCKRNRNKKKYNIELEDINKLIIFIQSLTLMFLILGVIGILLSKRNIATDIIYGMVISINILLFTISIITKKYFSRKSSVLSRCNNIK